MLIGSIGSQLLGGAVLGAVNGGASVGIRGGQEPEAMAQSVRFSGRESGASAAGPTAQNAAAPIARKAGGGSASPEQTTPGKAGETPTAGQMSGQATQMQGAGRTEKGRFDRFECQTCQNRTYQDGSDDPGVSFKTPTKLSPQQAATAVMSHEREHVSRNQAKAAAEDREVVSQSISLQMGVCSECGKSYVAGGVTRTVTASKQADRFRVGQEEPQPTGKALDAVA